MWKQYIGESPACRRAGAWVILNKTGGGGRAVAGKIIAAYPSDGAGRLRLTLWDWSNPEKSETQDGTASGYGYNKVAAVLSRMTFAGHPISEGNWEQSFRDAGYDVLQIL